MSIDLQELPAFPQSQESLSRQIAILIAVANRLGLYDAADAVYRLTPRLDEVKCGCHVVYAQGRELILAYHKRVGEVPHPVGFAAALEALADRVAPPLDRLGLMHPAARDETQAIRNDILAIAAQLRGDTTQPQPHP